MENVTADSPSSFLLSVMLLICTSEMLFMFRMFRIVRAAASFPSTVTDMLIPSRSELKLLV